MDRRSFGKTILVTAASLGLSKISLANVLAKEANLSFDSSNPLPVLVIGTGYGAAVTAKRLTAQGVPVTMLEMGRLWDQPGWDGKIYCPILRPDGRAMWFKNQTETVTQTFFGIPISFPTPSRAGTLDVLGPDDMRVFVGRGVGGGSLVNMATYITPRRDIFERQLPDVDADEMYDVYFPRAMACLDGRQVPEDLIEEKCYRYSRVGIEAAEGAGIQVDRLYTGYDYEYMRQEIDSEVPASAVAGEAMYGNNFGKKSLDKTYLADAMGSGLLTILALHEATEIRPTSSGYVVSAKEIDIYGNLLASHEIHCNKLFMGAGSMGTSSLLVKSRHRGDLPELSADVGTQWGPNSDIFGPRLNKLCNPTGHLQATIPSSSFNTGDDKGKPVFSMIIPFPIGFETFISFNLVTTDNSEAGHFEYDPKTDTATLNWREEQQTSATQSCFDVFTRLNAASGSKFTTAMFGDDFIGRKASYHPLGGCPLSKVTDNYGRVNNYPGLYIIDGSLIPVGILANPALTVTALAERNIERIIEEDFTV
jgi:cholesterol oxidase